VVRTGKKCNKFNTNIIFLNNTVYILQLHRIKQQSLFAKILQNLLIAILGERYTDIYCFRLTSALHIVH